MVTEVPPAVEPVLGVMSVVVGTAGARTMKKEYLKKKFGNGGSAVRNGSKQNISIHLSFVQLSVL